MATQTHTSEVPAPVTAPATTPVVPKGPRSYLVMMILAVLMLPSGLARAYRGEQSGWTRFWVYVGASVAMIIPFLNILAGLALIGLAIWGVVDVFQLRKTKTDAEGGALLTSERDEKFAKGFFIYLLVQLGIAALALLLALLFIPFMFNVISNAPNSPNDYFDTYRDSQYFRNLEN